MDEEQERFYRENLPPEMFEAWKHLQQNKFRMLMFPEYTLGDVLEVTGLTKATLLNWLNRNLIMLSTEHNPGYGRRRLYTALDILSISVAQKLSTLGLPLAMLRHLSELIKERSIQIIMAGGGQKGLFIILQPDGEGWRAFYDYGDEDHRIVDHEGDIAEISVLLMVDKLIERVLKELAEMKGRFFVAGTADDMRKAADKLEQKEKE